MVNDALPIEMWELPGPHGWVRRLARELDGGKSCLVVMPDGASADPHLLGIVEALAAQTRAEHVPADPGRSMIDAIIDHLDDGTYPGGNNPFRALANWEVLAGHTLIVRAWEHHDPEAVEQFATRWPAALHEAGLVPEERPRLILVCRPKDAGHVDLYRTDGLNLVVRWWWAALGRLDTDVVVSMAADGLGPIERAIVSELAGWNLEGAVALGKAWDGLLSSLEDAINRTFDTDRDTFSRPVTSKRPPKDLLEVWSTRRVDVGTDGSKGPPAGPLLSRSKLRSGVLSHESFYLILSQSEPGSREPFGRRDPRSRTRRSTARRGLTASWSSATSRLWFEITRPC